MNDTTYAAMPVQKMPSCAEQRLSMAVVDFGAGTAGCQSRGVTEPAGETKSFRASRGSALFSAKKGFEGGAVVNDTKLSPLTFLFGCVIIDRIVAKRERRRHGTDLR